MKLDELASILYALEYHEESECVEESISRYRRYVRSLDHPPWEDGKHCGDCTKVPCMCHRCFVEKIRNKAQLLIDESELYCDHSEAFKLLYGMLDILDEGNE